MTWNYLRESMSTYMSQPNPVTSRWEGEDHLRDSTFQLDAFRVSFLWVLYSVTHLITPYLTCPGFTFLLQYRTSRLLHSAAMRLQKHTRTLGSFGAWNRCLNHLLTLAESHIESVILETFIKAVKKYCLLLVLLLTSHKVCFP